MGYTLGWYFTVGSPLRAAEENKNKMTSGPPNQLIEENYSTTQGIHLPS
jgi:hypothetical protein